MVSSFLYGEIPMKCKSCIWANKVNEQLIHCSFYKRCVKEDGWIADENRRKGKNIESGGNIYEK